ncbi:exported hypothetical protein [Agrobacterium fabrum str. J-07]|nr:exported hypothetical protein [Agrobacterium fabrum str. J-07]
MARRCRPCCALVVMAGVSFVSLFDILYNREALSGEAKLKAIREKKSITNNRLSGGGVCNTCIGLNYAILA